MSIETLSEDQAMQHAYANAVTRAPGRTTWAEALRDFAEWMEAHDARVVEAATGSDGTVHWVGDAPTSLHGNGAASFERTTRDRAEVTCSLCLSLLDRESSDGGLCLECGMFCTTPEHDAPGSSDRGRS